MRTLSLALLCSACLSASLAACTGTPKQEESSPSAQMTVQNEAPVKATVKTITKEALKARLAEATTPVLLDVRSQEEFDAGHIEGAILIPVDRLEERIAELQQNKDAEIIVYCHTGRRSTRAAEILAGNGFSNITNFTGGWSAWSE